MSEHEAERPAPRVPEKSQPGQDQTAFTFSSDDPPPSNPPATGVRLEIDKENVGWILFDLPGEKVNKLTTSVMDTLRALLDQALRRNVQGLVFASDKPSMFIAGAAIEEIAGVTDPAEGTEKAARGQSVFEAIAGFPRPTVAAIAGPCLGGGYELALACRYRVAENTSAVKIGLPEVKLGILPGFGGTQRLPRQAGIRTALDVILAGKTLPAKPAFKRGMVDALVPEGQARRVAREVVTGERKVRRFVPSRVDRAMASVPPLRNFVFKRAGEALGRKVRRDHYPSPFMALEAVAAGYRLGEVEAFGREARLLGEAIVTPTSKSLTWLFQVAGDSRRPEGLNLDLATKPKRLAVVGAGVMGGGIAWLAGENGFPIRIKDIRPEALDGALATAGGLWARAAHRRRLTMGERDRRLEKLSTTLDYRGFTTVDFVVEAVVEDLAIKRKVVAELENVLGEHDVIASNTSSLRIGDIAAEARHPERVVGLHFFNPVERMPLVEVIAGPASAPEAVATAYRLALDLGKTPILVQDSPGFLVNRLLAFYLGEALQLLESGVDAQTLDHTLTEFGMPMGPIALLDQIGLDVADKVTHVVEVAFGDRLPGSAVIGRLVQQGHLGKKSGRGFYVYDARGKSGAHAPQAHEAAGSPARREMAPADLLDRLLFPMINEAARCLDEGVVSRPLDVDLGMVMGTGFPPFRGGLLRWADSRGVLAVVERLEALALSDARLAPSEALCRRTGGFYASHAGTGTPDAPAAGEETAEQDKPRGAAPASEFPDA